MANKLTMDEVDGALGSFRDRLANIDTSLAFLDKRLREVEKDIKEIKAQLRSGSRKP
jgi:archaellum component FlaC